METCNLTSFPNEDIERSFSRSELEIPGHYV